MPDFPSVMFFAGIVFVIACIYLESRRRNLREVNDQIAWLSRERRYWMDEAGKGYLFRAEQGDVDSMLSVADYFTNGAKSRIGLAEVAQDPHTNFAAALQWYEKAAEKGSADAMFSLGYMHHIGITPGLWKNGAAAEYWYERAIEAGHKEAVAWLKLSRERA